MSFEQCTDVELIARVSAGDQAALGHLYERHAGLALGLACRIVGDRSIAEDIVHDAFLEVYKRAMGFDSTRASFRSWLLLIVRSRALDVIRSARWQKSTPLCDHLDSDRAEFFALTAGTSDHDRVTCALDTLPDVQRDVLYLAYFKAMSMSEIASALGLPLGTVKSRTAAALAALRKHLDWDPNGKSAS